jgi:effector-binding domain-containing protein
VSEVIDVRDASGWYQGALGELHALLAAQAELAVITHSGGHQDVDLAYGSLAAYVTDHALSVEGPIREYYVVGPHETADEGKWRTEIGWPIFHTGPA